LKHYHIALKKLNIEQKLIKRLQYINLKRLKRCLVKKIFKTILPFFCSGDLYALTMTGEQTTERARICKKICKLFCSLSLSLPRSPSLLPLSLVFIVVAQRQQLTLRFNQFSQL